MSQGRALRRVGNTFVVVGQVERVGAPVEHPSGAWSWSVGLVSGRTLAFVHDTEADAIEQCVALLRAIEAHHAGPAAR